MAIKNKMPPVAMTAMFRTTLSAPARWLFGHGLLSGRALDYGSGRGSDALLLQCDRYDPHWFTRKPRGYYDRILCTYVLNVVTAPEQFEVLRRIGKLLRPGGIGFVSVRRDLPKGGSEGRVFQSYVELNLPILVENRGFCIYVL